MTIDATNVIEAIIARNDGLPLEFANGPVLALLLVTSFFGFFASGYSGHA
jgi:hypothetical protein